MGAALQQKGQISYCRIVTSFPCSGFALHHTRNVRRGSPDPAGVPTSRHLLLDPLGIVCHTAGVWRTAGTIGHKNRAFVNPSSKSTAEARGSPRT